MRNLRQLWATHPSLYHQQLVIRLNIFAFQTTFSVLSGDEISYEVSALYQEYKEAVNLKRLLKNTAIYIVKKFFGIQPQDINENTYLTQINPVCVAKSTITKKRLNLLLPTINKEHLFGGIATALRLFLHLKDKLGDEFLFRIIITDEIPYEKDANAVSGFLYNKTPQDDLSEQNQLISVCQRTKDILPVSENDIFIATAWWTCFLLEGIIKRQTDIFSSSPDKSIYLIQDYEPGFYPWSARYVLAEKSYHLDTTKIAVFNSSFLHQYFKNNEYSFPHEFCFEPKMNKTLKEYLNAHKPSFNKKRKIIVYGRPSVKRNAFPLIVESLKIWAEQNKNAGSWEIISAGDTHKTIDLGNGIKLASVGKLSLDDYCRELSESAIGISFMISPHPSYPPLEMANFGLLTISNLYDVKDLSQWHENIHSAADTHPEAIAGKISELCEMFESDQAIGLKAKNLKDCYLNDEQPFDCLEPLVKLLQ